MGRASRRKTRRRGASAPPPGQDARPRLKRRSRPWWQQYGRIGAVVATIVVAAGLYTGWQVWQARAELLAAQRDLGGAVSSLPRGDAEAALAGFAGASAATSAASSRLEQPPVVAFSWLPGLGDTIRSARRLSASAGLVARAGEELSAAAVALPGGVGALAPDRGRIPVAQIRAVAPALATAHGLLVDAATELEGAPTALVPAVVREAVLELDAQLATVEPQLGTAAVMAEALPAFLGADEPRRYFVGAQNPAELRGAGGFIGAYSILEVDDGALDFEPFRSIINITTLPVDGVEPPNPEYAERYDRFGGAGFAQNANMSPDIPAVATALERLVAQETGEPVDGTILVDPFALEALVDVVGAVEVPDVGEVDADSLVDEVTNRAYQALPDSPERKEVLGDVAGEVLDRFLAEAAGRPVDSGEALISIAADGHLWLHSTDEAVQQAFAEVGIDGRLGALEGGDFLTVTGNNGAQNKVDYFTDRSVDVDVTLFEDGSADVRVTVALANDAPTTGQPIDVIGPNLPYLEAGENRTYLSVFGPAGAEHVATSRGGAPSEPTRVESEAGHPVVSTWELLAPGEEESVTHRFIVEDAWSVDDGYRLELRGQSTVRPTDGEVRIELPGDLAVRGASPGVGVVDEGARWRGELRGRVGIEIAVGPPARTPLREIIDWLGEPVFGHPTAAQPTVRGAGSAG